MFTKTGTNDAISIFASLLYHLNASFHPDKVKLTVHALFRSSGNYELARLSRASLQVSIFPRFHIASLIDYCSYIEHVFFFPFQTI